MSDPFPDSEDLIRSTAPLRRIARGMLYDHHRAEDTVQEAWLALVRRNPPRGSGLGGWLAGTVRRLSSNVLRAEARRRGREERAARSEAVEGVDDALARLELLRRVGDAVERLEEPYRSTVLLRFFEEVSVREIARRTDVPIATVHTRLRRGLERLRGKLDDGSESRSLLLGALVPFAGKMPLSVGLGWPLLAAPKSVSGILKGALVMKLKIAVGLALALGGVSYYLVGGGERDEGLESRAHELANLVRPNLEPDSGEEAANRAQVASSADARTEVTGQGLEDRGPWITRGTMTRGMTLPFAGGRIEARLHRGYEPTGELVAEAELHADEFGLFEWALPEPAGPCVIELRTLSEGFFGPAVRHPVPPGTKAPEALLLHAFPADAWLIGLVLDENAVPIPDANVATVSKETTSDDEGRFRIAATSMVPDRNLWVRAPGFAEISVSVPPASPGDVRVPDIVLRRELRVRGRVRDPEGHPVAGAEVLASYSNRLRTETDAAGRFEIGHIDRERGSYFKLRVRAQGFLHHQEQLDSDAGTEPFEIVLQRGARLGGTVRQADGSPAVGVRMSLGMLPQMLDLKHTHTDVEGHFYFPSVPSGEQTLWGARAGWVSIKEGLALIDGEQTRVELVQERGLSIRGTVVDEKGDPVPFCGVYAAPQRIADFLVTPGQCDARGRFRLAGLPALPLTVGALSVGFTKAEKSIHPGEVDDIVLQLQRSAGLAGRVLDARTDEAISEFRIRLVDAELRPGEEALEVRDWAWKQSGYPFVDDLGNWRFTSQMLQPGRVTGLEVSAPGYAPLVVSRVIVQSQARPADLVLRLHPGGVVRGTIRDALTGLPVPGAEVLRFTAEEPLPPFTSHASASQVSASQLSGRRYTTRSDEEGRFELTGVPEGDMSLCARSDGRMEGIVGPFFLERSGTSEHFIELQNGGTVVGLVLDRDGTPLANETMLLMSLESSGAAYQQRVAETDAGGEARFESLLPGKYELSWRVRSGAMSFPILKAHVWVKDTGEARVVLQPVGSGLLHGTISFSEELPDFLPVQLSPTNTTLPAAELIGCARGIVARGERFEATDLCPGEYHVRVHHFDHRTSESIMGYGTVRVTADEVARIHIELERRNK